MKLKAFHIHLALKDICTVMMLETVSLGEKQDAQYVALVLHYMASHTSPYQPLQHRVYCASQYVPAPIALSLGKVELGETVYVIDDHYHITTYIMGGCGALEKQGSCSVSDFVNTSTTPFLVGEDGKVRQGCRVMQFTLNEHVICVGATQQLLDNAQHVIEIQVAVEEDKAGAKEFGQTLDVIHSCDALCDPRLGLEPEHVETAKKLKAEVESFGLIFDYTMNRSSLRAVFFGRFSSGLTHPPPLGFLHTSLQWTSSIKTPPKALF